MKQIPLYFLAACFVVGVVLADHPQVLVTPQDREAIQAKLEQSPWAKESYENLKARVDGYVALCKTNPQFMSSRLFMNWQSHYTTPIVRNSRTVGGEGHAPVPTPRFGGARDWATKYQPAAKLENLKPYNDTDGKVWLFNKETGKEEWADPSQTGRMFETVNERIIQTAADAGFIYWITGDEEYAKYASEILWTYMNGFSYMQPPKIVEGGGAQIIGFDSFEVIHEDIVTPLSLSYDFVHGYLQKQGKDVGLIQRQLKRMADRVIVGGSRDGNWNLNQARIIAYAGLALEANTNYPDGKGRAYYMDVVLNARLPAQDGLTHVIKEGYEQATGLWPEAPGYSFGTTKDILLIASLLSGDPAGRTVLADPILPRAMLAQAALVYPNGLGIGLGDTVNPRLNTVALELLIASARQRSDLALEDRLTVMLQREIDTGNYNRASNANLVALAKYVPDLKKSSQAIADGDRTFFGGALNVLMQRNTGDRPEHSLAAAMFGTAGGHVHANGLAIELFGAGLILGADPGRGVSYWQAEHGEYYSQPPAHNTVIVNGRSNYRIGRGQIAMKLDLLEPASGETGISPNISFAQSSFRYTEPAAEQQRTLALIRTGPQSGFYFDAFRSRAINTTNGFHDYLYHNIGQSLALKDGEGKTLALTATVLLSSTNGCLKGYDYFKDEKSVEFAGDLAGVFTTQLPGGSKHLMNVWMPRENGRRIFSVAAPANHAAREALPTAFMEMPMPTLLVRQQGDAWSHPFVAVYEPSQQNEGASITKVSAIKNSDATATLAAAFVEGKDFRVCLMQDDQAVATHTLEGNSFQGSFGVVTMRHETLSELYLGAGRRVAAGLVSLASVSTNRVDADLRADADSWICSASGPVGVTVTFKFPADFKTAAGWTVFYKAGETQQPVKDATLDLKTSPSGEKLIVATCALPAGQEQRLTLGWSNP